MNTVHSIYFDDLPLKVIETSDNRFYSVRETNDPNLVHVWFGIPVRNTARDGYVVKAKARVELVRKAASRVVFAEVRDPFSRIA